MSNINVIRNEEDHIKALEHLETLIVDGSEDTALLDSLALLIEDYEKRAYPIPPVSPIEAIQFRMAQLQLSQAQLACEIDFTRGRVSEILNGHRNLNLNVVRALHDKLDIPYDVLLASADIKHFENGN